jgi:NitT/TauT family transport system substrate-binding protein
MLKTVPFYLLLFVVVVMPIYSEASQLTRIVLATAGPGNVSHLPVDLIKKIGADKAEGVELVVRYFGGGPQAVKDMLDKNSDFVVMGMPALATFRLGGHDVWSIATVNRVPTFVLMVRSELKSKIRNVADLKGYTIGVNTSLIGLEKSTSQLLTEYMLKRAGVNPGYVNIIAVGQSLKDQSAAIESKTVDALMGDEPFASRLKADGKVFFLADLHDLRTTRSHFGGLFMNAQLATRGDILRERPEVAQKMVAMLVRTLKWIRAATPKQILEALQIKDKAQEAMLMRFLTKHKEIYSPDGRIVQEELKTAEAFFHEVYSHISGAKDLRFEAFTDKRFLEGVGR